MDNAYLHAGFHLPQLLDTEGIFTMRESRIIFDRTDGMNHRSSKLTTLTVLMIRAEYDSGLRGKARAEYWGITPGHYSNIGRRQQWKKLEGIDWP